MQLATRESPAGDTLKIAVLAALNIADEYFRARQEGASQRSPTSPQRALELERMLDLALGAPEALDPRPGRRRYRPLPGPPVHSKILP